MATHCPDVETVASTEKGVCMLTARDCRRKALAIVFWSCFVIGLSGPCEPARAASDPPASPSQEQPAMSADPSGSTGKGAEGKGRGLRPGRKACAEDVKKLCAGVKAGEGRIMQCLREHTQELSPACNEMMQQRGTHRP